MEPKIDERVLADREADFLRIVLLALLAIVGLVVFAMGTGLIFWWNSAIIGAFMGAIFTLGILKKTLITWVVLAVAAKIVLPIITQNKMVVPPNSKMDWVIGGMCFITCFFVVKSILARYLLPRLKKTIARQ